MSFLVCILNLLLASSPVQASTSQQPWYYNLPVANVVLQAPEGGLPEESLEPLLRTRQGQEFHPRQVQLDLATLYRVGEFAEVEAHVEPWFIIDFAGNPRDAVLVQYRVRPAPLVQRVHIQGARSFQEQQLLNVLKINTGQPYYQDIDAPRTAASLASYLHREGYPDARVEVDVEKLDAHNVEVWVRVDEGTPNLLTELNFIGELAPEVTQDDLVRWAEKAGLEVGKPFKQNSIREAHQIIIREIGSFGSPFQPYRGWVSARVTPAVIQERGVGVSATFTIELGLRLELDVQGLGWRGERRVRDALIIDERLRITRGFLEEAPERLKLYLQERGYYDANVSVRLLQSRDHQSLKVRAERGPSHTVSHYEFEGNETLESRVLESIMKQASPEVLRRGYFTHNELETGISAITAYYRSAGYQDATIQFDRVEVNEEPRANDAPRRMRVHVTVDEGEQTTQASIWVEDAAIDVDVDFIREARENFSNKPFSPPLIERLASEVIEKHRQAGYLEASARVAHLKPMPDRVESIIDVSPGPKVLLRSVVTRGTKTIRPSFVRREVDLVLGEPLASTQIERVRRSLYDLGVFRSVSLDLLGDDDVRDLVISVQERPRWGFELGGGLSTDQGVRSFGRLTRRNLFGRAHMLDIYGVVGLEYGNFLQPEWRLALNYTAPRFPTRNQRLIIELLARERLQERTWTLGRTAGNASIEWDLNRTTQLRSQLRLEARQLLKVDTGTLIQGEPWTSSFRSTTQPCRHRFGTGLARDLLIERPARQRHANVCRRSQFI